MVKSSSTDEEYQVWLGSENQLVSCQCVDYKINKLPCKHICAVVNLPGIGWESLGASFQNHPLFRLDPAVVSTTSCEGQQTPVISCIESNNNPELGPSDSESLDKTAESDNSHASTVDYNQLKRRKQHTKPSGRNRCVSTLKALHDELYVIKDRAVLATLETMITNALTYARQNRPVENKLPLKDKTLSPSKKKMKQQRFPKKKTNLPLRVEKKRRKKRFGIAADNREKASKIKIEVDQSTTKNTSEKPTIIDLTDHADGQLNEKTPTWVTVKGIKLPKMLEKALLDSNSWLSDDHVDAAGRLLRLVNTGVRGFNDIVVMTHFKKTKVDLATKEGQTIQCHNIGSHWVVSSSSNGKVTVYNTLSTGLSPILLQQLVHLYQAFFEGGSLVVTVILQQLQKGLNDCGLFCIANATSLAHGIDPSSVIWDQSKMRTHLHQCFVEMKMSMFPHTVSADGNQFKIYKISL